MVGVATVDEAYLKKIAGSLSAFGATDLVGKASAASRLDRVSDADKAEIDAARNAFTKTRAAVAPAAALFDVIAAARISRALCVGCARGPRRKSRGHPPLVNCGQNVFQKLEHK